VHQTQGVISDVQTKRNKFKVVDSEQFVRAELNKGEVSFNKGVLHREAVRYPLQSNFETVCLKSRSTVGLINV
jgi:hypothetical protein